MKKNFLPFKLFSLSVLLLMAGHHQVQAQGKGKNPRPNIILILADDMGYSDIGCFGSEISTPNLDQLAEQGMRMTQFYNASRCCPSRASLLTGLYQHEAGIGDMVGNFGYPGYEGYLNHQCITLGEALKINGYNTYMAGKWHVGGEPENWPRKRGFDRYFGLIDGASNYFKLVPYRNNQPAPRMALDDQLYTPPDTGFYMTDAITDHALSYLEENKSKKEPFFLYLAFTAPHWPLNALPADIAKYKGKYMQGWEPIREKRFKKMQKLGILDTSVKLSPVDKRSPNWATLSQKDKEMWDLRMAVYAAMIDRLDQNVGRVIRKLKELHLDDNTLIIFLSDNGGCHEQIKNQGNYIHTKGITGNPDSFDSYEYPWANASNTPFRLYKHWVHEGGISTPFIAWYPSMIKAGNINKTTAHIIDIMPTLLDFAKGNYPKQFKSKDIKPMEGTSLLPLLEGGKIFRKNPLFWEHEGNRAVREGKWKLVSLYDTKNDKFGPWELYDINADRSELNDLSRKHPDKVVEMVKKYDSWAERIGVVSREKMKRGREKD
ncbi:MAG: arylsulfatase [Bacteroidota bacterium]|nr:arylsulfatase [Bacteroidota bacterium]